MPFLLHGSLRTEYYSEHGIIHENIAGVAFLAAFALYFVIWISTLEHFAALILVPAVTVTFGYLLWRIYLYVGELLHLRRKNVFDHIRLLREAFTDNCTYGLILTFCGSFLVLLSLCGLYDKMNLLRTIEELGIFPFCSSFCAFIFIFSIFRLYQCTSWEANIMRHMNGLDYGSGMAHSYFYGYLKLVLSSSGGPYRTSFLGKIQTYIEDSEGYIDPRNFPVRKLIILIPSTGYSYPTLKSPHRADIEPVEHLKEHLENRAGTANRQYRMGAYKLDIRSEENEHLFNLWALAEGPTPLLTFYEAYNGGSAEAAHLQKFKREVSRNFLKALGRLVQNDPDCRDLVELLYYRDDDGVDAVDVLKEFLLRERKKI